MKKIILLFFIIGITSCKKEPECYTCTTQSANDTFCKGDLLYNDIAAGKTVTDNYGNVYTCH